ncbi:MAG: matrixin family metalloprotease, partial [Candidatus Binatia bacterium]
TAQKGKPMNALFRIAASLALALALTPTRASAFVLDLDGVGNVLHWVLSGGAVGYRINTGTVPHGAAGEQAIHAAFASWSNASTGVEYRYQGATNARMANDGENTVLFVYDNWQFDSGFAALTFRYYDNRTGKLIDTDIAFNAERYAWSVGGTDFDIQNSATHEVGHFSGLGHSSVGDATMYSKTLAGETTKRSLHSDDVAGLQAIYGGSGGVVTPPVDEPSGGISSGSGGGGGGGCTTGPGASDALVAGLLSLGFALRRRTRSVIRR